ncbi:hypothetical protein OEIGOIKO_05774 [Streptomyces chrestomyceticus JCM 4735]|uniref:Uncharacterized protein n=1 Tax=Streptomyces chrestomyceticus JCM 4735 TaxID=1306181 RepID=A0A7U9KYX7_9ACTN|nr:hypothetical protein [Streptomyces chrestomyceticus]GCD37964.1 hypothetical protein OEIGOIKO_05774 [Streptomyces chrestomyceticus JCM 4735]
MARDINNEAAGVEADELTQIGTASGATALGSDGRATATEVHGDGTTVINGDYTHTNVSHTFNK